MGCWKLVWKKTRNVWWKCRCSQNVYGLDPKYEQDGNNKKIGIRLPKITEGRIETTGHKARNISKS